MTKAQEAFKAWWWKDRPKMPRTEEDQFSAYSFTAGYDAGRADLLAEIKAKGFVTNSHVHDDSTLIVPLYRLPDEYTFENGTPFKDKP